LGQSRSTERRILIQRDDEAALSKTITDLASEYGRYGYRRVAALLTVYAVLEYMVIGQACFILLPKDHRLTKLGESC
jgi:hypothetical protein